MIRILTGDCREHLGSIKDDSIHSCVTDPPYGLSFMSQHWDRDVPGVDYWNKVYRVLKPGAHLLAFGGTRTYHRMACAIEDAGFEIRDCCSWNYGSGFPKSHDVGKVLDAKEERCSCPEDLRDLPLSVDAADALPGSSQQDVLTSLQRYSDFTIEQGEDQSTPHAVRPVRQAELQSAVSSEAKRSSVLQPVLPQQDFCVAAEAARRKRERKAKSAQRRTGIAECGVEGRSDLSEASRQLREHQIRPMSAGHHFNGANGRLCDGASFGDGAVARASVDQDRVRSSPESQAVGKQPGELGTVARQQEPQVSGAWDNCRRCGKPIVPDGLGTALKPAMELIVLARKPLSESTVAANVLKWGTGALNIDGCRVGYENDAPNPATNPLYRAQNGYRPSGNDDSGSSSYSVKGNGAPSVASNLGRWPANVIHDGSEEVLAAFPDAPGQQSYVGPEHGDRPSRGIYGDFGARPPNEPRKDSGSAARFFYCAKASKADLAGSEHPTVKPVKLLRYLIRLVTPPDGVVLDLFAGTGTTGVAANAENRHAILIEQNPKYVAMIERRCKLEPVHP